MGARWARSSCMLIRRLSRFHQVQGDFDDRPARNDWSGLEGEGGGEVRMGGFSALQLV